MIRYSVGSKFYKYREAETLSYFIPFSKKKTQRRISFKSIRVSVGFHWNRIVCLCMEKPILLQCFLFFLANPFTTLEGNGKSANIELCSFRCALTVPSVADRLQWELASLLLGHSLLFLFLFLTDGSIACRIRPPILVLEGPILIGTW